MTSYHLGPAGIEPFTFLTVGGETDREEPITVVLDADERERKRRMLACFRTQRQTLAYFPAAVERFRVAPAYDFARPPHAGRLFYEHFDWGMTGERFRGLARDAWVALGLGGGKGVAAWG